MGYLYLFYCGSLGAGCSSAWGGGLTLGFAVNLVLQYLVNVKLRDMCMSLAVHSLASYRQFRHTPIPASPGNPWSQSWRRRTLRWEGFEKECFNPAIHHIDSTGTRRPASNDANKVTTDWHFASTRHDSCEYLTCVARQLMADSHLIFTA